jgi:hypothetical protein
VAAKAWDALIPDLKPKIDIDTYVPPKPTPKPEKPKPADDESAKPLKHRIRDKVFVFRREVNMWYDEVYKEETMQFRLLKLTRDTKEYKEVLAKEPMLKEFFDHGPILVVWKNKIYKVR